MKYKVGEQVEAAFGPVGIIDTRNRPRVGPEYLVGRVKPDLVAIRPDGSPVYSHGHPHWVPEYLLRPSASGPDQ